MKKSLLQTLFVTAILSGMNGVVSAGGGQDTSKLDEYTLDDVVVTAQRVETKDLDTPATTTVITAQQLKDSGAQTAFDALERIPGVNAYSYGPAGEGSIDLSRINIRGLDKGTLVLIDGSPANLMNYNQIMNAIPVESIEKIEVVKGAASVLYGAEAMAGVINIITKKPTDNQLHGSVTGMIGSHERNYAVALSGQNFSAQYKREYRKEISQYNHVFPYSVPGENFTRKSRDNSIRDTVFLNLRLSDKLTANYAYNESAPGHKEFKYNPAVKDWVTPYKHYLYAYKTNRFALVYDDKDTGLKSSLAYLKHTTRPLNADSSTDTDATSWNFDTQKEWTLRGGLDTLVAGLDFHREGHVKRHSANHGSIHRDQYAVFASYTRQMNDRFSATLGIREHFVKGNGYDRRQSIFLPQIQTLYRMSPRSMWYVNIGKSFETPAANSAFYGSKKVSTKYRLKPQEGWTYETGMKFGDAKESLKIALFHMDIKNQFKWVSEKQYFGFGDDKANMQINRDKFRNTGLELEYAKQLSSRWRMRLGGYVGSPEAKEGNGGWRQAEARVQFFAGAQYRIDKLRINTDWYVTADRQDSWYLSNGKYVGSAGSDHAIPNRIEGNLTMEYTISPMQSVSFGIYNLLDRENPINDNEHWSLPRNYRLSYTYRF